MTDLQFKQIMNQIHHSFAALVLIMTAYVDISNGISGVIEWVIFTFIASLAIYNVFQVKYVK